MSTGAKKVRLSIFNEVVEFDSDSEFVREFVSPASGAQLKIETTAGDPGCYISIKGPRPKSPPKPVEPKSEHVASISIAGERWHLESDPLSNSVLISFPGPRPAPKGPSARVSLQADDGLLHVAQNESGNLLNISFRGNRPA
ncbi:MAG: hypothetical protein WAK31_00900 [Chthoniobacterales bacterium]